MSWAGTRPGPVFELTRGKLMIESELVLVVAIGIALCAVLIALSGGT